MKEYQYYTAVLKMAARQQQQQQQQQQNGSGPGASPNSIPTPSTFNAGPGSPGQANGQPHAYPYLQQQQTQTQTQTQPQPSVQQAQQAATQAAQQEQPGPHRSLFTEDQSLLLKAQIQSLKIMANNMNVPPEIMMVIDRSLTALPDFKSILTALSADLQRQVESTKQGAQQAGLSQQQAQPTQRTQATQSTRPAQPAQQHTAVPVSQPLQPLSKPAQNRFSEPDVKKRTPTPVRVEASPHAPSEPPIASTKQPVLEDGDPPKQLAPLLISKYKKQNKDIDKFVEVHSTDIMVDCFSYPETASRVNYTDLFNDQLHITPSLLSTGLDPRSAMETYQTLIALDLDTSLDFYLQQLLSNHFDEEARNQLILEFNALQLLPLQKAVRGHVLSFEWYQSSLLTNVHPNFLSKNRNLNLQDALMTQELFKSREIQQFEKQKKKRSTKLNSILQSCKSTYDLKIDRKANRVKLGHRLVSLHANLEKEEQKRIERNAKQRLQALKANDEEAYIKLLDQTKDTRITHLLKQTNSFLDSLTKAVKDQQSFTKDKIESHIDPTKLDQDTSHPVSPISENDQDFNKNTDNEEYDEEERERIDYYEVAHHTKEEIKQQPSILVGGTLKEYQLKGLQWMVSLFNNHLNGILADEMGLGKTIQTISLLTYLYETKGIHGPFLVIVPLSTLTNWNAEFDKWAPALRKIAFKGPPSERKPKQALIRARQFDVVLTTFEYIIKERPLLSKIKWVHTIIDEGHRMKNAQSKLSLTLNTHYHSDYRLILTGTPLQNNLPELWALLNFVLPKIFNSVKSFDEWFNTPFANTGGQDKIALSEEETLLVIRRLHKVLRPFLLRRLKKDVEKELPDKVEKVLKCKMSALQHKLYQQMLKHRRLFIFDEQSNQKLSGSRGFNNQIMQLRKICNHPFVFEEVEDQINPNRETNDTIWRSAGKFELLGRVLPKFKESGHRVLIFFQMTQVMDIMEDYLRQLDMKYLRLDGHTKSDDRTTLLNLFNAPNSEYFCFLLSTRAGGLGLNLQTADTVIIFDTDWNPHQDLQAQDRAHRIGQKNEVRILRLITDNSVEEAILDRAHAKLDIDGKVIQAGKFDNKSTAEEQEALLRSLLEAEEEEKKRRELGIEEEEQLDDHELNEILARNDDELTLFQEIDAKRTRLQLENGITSRLMENSELPECYNVDIDAKLAEEEKEKAFVGGRGNRERKTTHYSDELSEEQWLRQFEVSDSEDNEGGPKRRRTRTNSNAKRAKLEGTNELDGPATGTENTPIPDPVESNGPDSLHTLVGGKSSIKTAKKSNKGKKRTASVRKNGRTYLRSVDETMKPLKDRQEISKLARELYDYAVYYLNADDRRLSDIFLVKPSKRLYPDYYLLIKYPAAFENIMKHIELNAYDSLKQVVEDFHLVFANARIYNTEDSIVFKDSLELEDAIITKYKEMTKETDDIDFTEFNQEYTTAPLIPTPLDTSDNV